MQRQVSATHGASCRLQTDKTQEPVEGANTIAASELSFPTDKALC